jgi:hypothetical protein
MGGIRSNPDVRRMGNGMSYPGIDPRQWIKYGKVTDVGFDAKYGMFADVQFEGTGQNETCLIGSPYADADAGENPPIQVGQRVCVLVPGGNSDNGPIIVCAVWNAFYTPPIEFQDATNKDEPTKDRVIKIKKGNRYRLLTENGDVIVQTSGSGNIDIETTGTGTTKIKSATKCIVECASVELGNANPTIPIALATPTVTFLTGLQSALASVNAALIAFSSACSSATVEPKLAPAATALGTACGSLSAAIGALSSTTIPSVTTKSS